MHHHARQRHGRPFLIAAAGTAIDGTARPPSH
jgi:hypothetical protein